MEQLAEFSSWLFQLGNGTLTNTNGLEHGTVQINENFLSEESLITEIFGESLDPLTVKQFSNRAILCPKNDYTFHINDDVLNRLEGEKYTYYSVDTIDANDEQERLNFPTEFLNSLTPSGMPPHQLNLKIGAIVMILRNLNTKTRSLQWNSPYCDTIETEHNNSRSSHRSGKGCNRFSASN